MAGSFVVPAQTVLQLNRRLSRPETELSAGLDEPGDRLRIAETDQPFIGVRIHADLPQQGRGARRKRDELAMGEGISNEVARGGFASEALRTFLGKDQRHRVEQDRRPAIDHVLGRDQRTVRRLHSAHLGGDDFHCRAFLLDRGSELLQKRRVSASADQHADLAALAYVLAAGAPEHTIDADVYHEGFASGPGFRNGRSYLGIELPLGMDHGGPLFIAHYSFCGLDPRGLSDRHADYWQQNVRHTRINYEHYVAIRMATRDMGRTAGGLRPATARGGYVAHAPGEDIGVITPSAALASFPYTPEEAMRALRYFLTKPKHRIWGRFGLVDAFCQSRDWYARTYLAINQGPIVIMIENFRSGLLWSLFMSAPEVQSGLQKLGFESPHLSQAGSAAAMRPA